MYAFSHAFPSENAFALSIAHWKALFVIVSTMTVQRFAFAFQKGPDCIQIS